MADHKKNDDAANEGVEYEICPPPLAPMPNQHSDAQSSNSSSEEDEEEILPPPPPPPPEESHQHQHKHGTKQRRTQQSTPSSQQQQQQQPNDTTDDNDDNGGMGPTGHWKHGLCECFDVICCTPICVMATLCNPVLLAQIMTRMGLDWCGLPNPEGSAGTFSYVVMLWFTAVVCLFVPWIGVFFLPFYVIYRLCIQTRTRYQTRRYFQIPPDCCECCDGMLEDCLCGTICSCCNALRMARHTHDETMYQYQFDQPTGLPENAPLFEVV